MKKHLYLSIFFVVLCSLFTSQVRAESAENVTRRRPDRPVQAEIQEIRQERRSNVAENHANRLERRFAFYDSRLRNIITRFEKRLDILKADGKDITAVSAKLTEVKSKLESAKAKGVEAVAAFKAIDPAQFSEQKVESFAARDLAVATRKLYLEVHVLLKDALKALKVISKPALPAASVAVEQAN